MKPEVYYLSVFRKNSKLTMSSFNRLFKKNDGMGLLVLSIKKSLGEVKK